MVRAVSIAVLILLCFILGTCYAEENTGYVAYFQGGESALSEGTNGTMILTLNDVVPYYNIPLGSRNFMMPLTADTPYELPLNAALIQNGAEGETIYLVKISSWTFVPDKKELSLEVKPVEFYEGDLLKEFASEKQELTLDKAGKVLNTGLYLEVGGVLPENNAACDPNYWRPPGVRC